MIFIHLFICFLSTILLSISLQFFLPYTPKDIRRSIRFHEQYSE